MFLGANVKKLICLAVMLAFTGVAELAQASVWDGEEEREIIQIGGAFIAVTCTYEDLKEAPDGSSVDVRETCVFEFAHYNTSDHFSFELTPRIYTYGLCPEDTDYQDCEAH